MATIHLTKDGFDKAISSGTAMVDFWASWCGPCKMLSPVIEDLAGRYEGRALVGKVNVDDEPELAARFGVMSIPTVVLVKDGKEVDFWASWCGPCRMVGPTIEQLAQEYEGRASVGKVNVDEEGGLAGDFGVMSIPTVVLFKDGKEVERLVGVRTIEEYKAIIDAHL